MAQRADLAEVHAQLDAFVRWFGDDRLNRAQSPLRAPDLSPLQHTQLMKQQWVVRDLLTYVAARAHGAVDEDLVFERLMPLCRLASAVLRFERPGAMTVPGRFRDLLLGDACADFAFEVISAAHHDWKGYQIQWLPEGVIGGEFAARQSNDEPEVFVECKRLAADLVELLKTEHVVPLADILERALRAHAWCGTVRLDIGPRHIGRPTLVGVVEQLATELVAGLGAGQREDVSMRFDLRPVDGVERPYAELLTLAGSRDPVHRVITGRREGDVVRRPRVLEFSGPKRGGDWFARKVETVAVENAADRQLSMDAPGVVCLELPMFRTVEPEVALQIVEPVLEMLFDRAHVIGLFAVLDLATEVHVDFARANAAGRAIWNERSRFPAARDLWRQRMMARA